MIRGISVGNFTPLHIDLEDGKVGDEPCIDTVDTHIGDRLILCRRLTVEGGDICHIPLHVYKVDIGILVDSYQALGLLAPANMGDMGVAQSVGTVKGCDTLVVEVVLIESVRCQYEEIVAC